MRLRYRLEMSDNPSAAESRALNRDISQLEALIEELLTYADSIAHKMSFILANQTCRCGCQRIWQTFRQ